MWCFFDILFIITILIYTTAAHCLHQKDKTEMRIRDILLMFGAYNLNEKSGAQFRTPSEIILHDDWNPFVETYDADIALLIMDNEVLLSKLITPICIWDSAKDPKTQSGITAGWGKANSEASHEMIPKQLSVPIKSQEDCLFSNAAFQKLASKRTFCGGSRDGSGPCTGE